MKISLLKLEIARPAFSCGPTPPVGVLHQIPKILGQEHVSKPHFCPTQQGGFQTLPSVLMLTVLSGTIAFHSCFFFFFLLVLLNFGLNDMFHAYEVHFLLSTLYFYSSW